MEQNITQYVFKPKPEVADWIDENISSWTQFCYDNIYITQKKEHFEFIKKVNIGISTVLLGIILISCTYIVNSFFVWLTLLSVGIWFIICGFYITGWEVRNGRKRRV